MTNSVIKILAAVAACIALSSMPAASSVQMMGGVSAIDNDGGGIVLGITHAQIRDSTDDPSDPDFFPGRRILTAEIRSAVEIPVEKKGEASAVWDVPESSSTTMTVTGSDGGFSYELMAGAFGRVSASVSKESAAGYAYSRSSIYSAAYALWSDGLGSPPLVFGEARMGTEARLTGTGTVSSCTEGAAMYGASLDLDVDVDDEPDLITSGIAQGRTTMAAENVFGGTVSGIYNVFPLVDYGGDIEFDDYACAYIEAYGQASPGDTHASSIGTIGLAARRSPVRSGATAAEAIISGESAVSSEVTGTAENGLDSKAASVGCTGTRPVTVDSAASVSAPAGSDHAYAYTWLAPYANADRNPYSQDIGAYADNDLLVFSEVQRPATCCAGGDPAIALSEVSNAIWDASAIDEGGQGLWEVCISGATGMTRDGDPEIATEPGFATGAISVNRKGIIQSYAWAGQAATANDERLLTSSHVDLYLKGPKYDGSAGNVDDAAGARFAIDYETMGAGNGEQVLDDTLLATVIAGPDAFLWITGVDTRSINGHYADDGISIYDVEYAPLGFGTTAGPEIDAYSLGISRLLELGYGTSQESIFM